jgi:hypothetical protein
VLNDLDRFHLAGDVVHAGPPANRLKRTDPANAGGSTYASDDLQAPFCFTSTRVSSPPVSTWRSPIFAFRLYSETGVRGVGPEHSHDGVAVRELQVLELLQLRTEVVVAVVGPAAVDSTPS